MTWLAKGPVLAALYPIFMLLGQLAVAIGAAATLASVAGWVTLTGGAALNRLLGMSPDTGHWVWLLVGGAVFWMIFLPICLSILRWFKSKDDKTFAYYLMHDYAYTAKKRGAYPEEIEARLHEFRHRVEAALREDIDEVLIVGHSSGAQLAVSLVADILREKPFGYHDGPKLSLLTLGQVIPMVSFLPNADRLRRDLRLLSTAEQITWIDISAPGDGCSFALSDPVAVSGVAPEKGQQWPTIISAAFSKTLSKERQKELRQGYGWH